MAGQKPKKPLLAAYPPDQQRASVEEQVGVALVFPTGTLHFEDAVKNGATGLSC